MESVQEWWEETSTTILRVGQEVLGMTTGRRPPGDKETWWWNDKVQEVIKAKKVAKKIWDASRRQEDKDRYRQANKAAKKAVATTKALAMNELYEELETTEGERMRKKDSEGPRQSDQGFLPYETDKERTRCGFKRPDHRKMEGLF